MIIINHVTKESENVRKRVRELGVIIGDLPTGEHNAITDVPSVLVGHVTLSEDLGNEDVIRTGVTAILPHQQNPYHHKVPAATHVMNGYGKATGFVQIDELGEIESPIMLTGTFTTGSVLQGTMEYMMGCTPEIGDTTGSINTVVGECNDSYLHTARTFAVKPTHAIQAIERATSNCEEGSVGGGTGMTCYQYKGGIGTSSRIVQEKWTVGVLVNTNFGLRGEFESGHYKAPSKDHDTPAGSIMVVIATDAPVSDRQLKRIAKRASVGINRTGGRVHHASGDIIIAFSNANARTHFSEEEVVHSTYIKEDTKAFHYLLQATIEATEEAILNSLTMAETTTGRNGRIIESISYDVFESL
ncbi:S58 family peptidase [Pontibacillus yanchengensis]|uniref:S58 family peptidase n=2 Tax=Pontibacillus yanchengensis TaxID=462910 RepID=A0ACC7VBN8_9BACI|nr:P1 family peptidase [Pontibacillus yanchengensis]MYL34718.1 S58 family peptidase [Pontibacillus yanchengensis]MYL52296.1 S58 family peptidase [Pontibacillus yanchengensis]